MISGYGYPEINKFPRHNTRKSIDFRVLLPGNVPNISDKICWFLPRFQGIFTKVVFFRKCPGILTRKSIDFRVTIPGNKLISGYCYSEINLFPGNNTQKSVDFRVSCPGNRYEKNLILCISMRKRKYFSIWIQGPGTIDSWKKPEVKNLMLQSLKIL